MKFDAAGNIPKEETLFEKKWKEKIKSGELQKRYDELIKRQSLSLKQKIELTLDRIEEWISLFEGNVSVSYSGGKDSEVLLDLVRKVNVDIPAVFCHTGLEYPEIISRVTKTKNIRIMRPKMSFKRVLEIHGWPVISKKVARGIEVLRNPTKTNCNVRRLYDEGINRFGDQVSGFKIANRWRFLLDAPFKISDRCCEVMKKEPLHRYIKETGRVQFVGTMADDSKQRQRIYLQTGCNAYDLKNPRSAPLSFWTNQDILQYLMMYNIDYASVYGKIVQNKINGKLEFTGVNSTGCVFCCFGLHMEDYPNRFQKLYNTHHKLWKYCRQLGLNDVLEYIKRYCPDRRTAQKFNMMPVNKSYQIELFK